MVAGKTTNFRTCSSRRNRGYYIPAALTKSRGHGGDIPADESALTLVSKVGHLIQQGVILAVPAELCVIADQFFDRGHSQHRSRYGLTLGRRSVPQSCTHRGGRGR